MDLRNTSQAAGRAALGNEQALRCMTGQTASRAPPGTITKAFIQQTWRHSVLGERQTVKTGQESDPHYVWLERTEIRSVCRPPSKSRGDTATLTSNLRSLI